MVVNGISDESLAAQREAYLHIDIYRIDQVIRNLITNAVGQWLFSISPICTQSIYFSSNTYSMSFICIYGTV